MTTLMSGTQGTDNDAEELWQLLKMQLNTAAVQTLGYCQRNLPDWFDENNETIGELVRAKKLANLDSLNVPINLLKKQKLHDARLLLTSKLRTIKNEWWVTQSKRIQSFAGRRQHEEFFGLLKTIFGRAIQHTETLRDSETGLKLTEQNDVLGAQNSHFNSLLNRPENVD